MAFSIERTRNEATDIARNAQRYSTDLEYLGERMEDLKELSNGIQDSWIDEETIESTLESVADEMDQVEEMRQSSLKEARQSRADLETLREDTESAREQTQMNRRELEAQARRLEGSGLTGALDDSISEARESDGLLEELGRFLEETASELDDIIDGFGSPDIGHGGDGVTDAGAKLRGEAMGRIADGIAAAESMVLEGADETLLDQQFAGALGQMAGEGPTYDDVASWAQERSSAFSEAMAYVAADADSRDYQGELERSVEMQGHIRDVGLAGIAGIGLAAQGIRNLKAKRSGRRDMD